MRLKDRTEIVVIFSEMENSLYFKGPLMMMVMMMMMMMVMMMTMAIVVKVMMVRTKLKMACVRLHHNWPWPRSRSPGLATILSGYIHTLEKVSMKYFQYFQIFWYFSNIKKSLIFKILTYIQVPRSGNNLVEVQLYFQKRFYGIFWKLEYSYFQTSFCESFWK